MSANHISKLEVFLMFGVIICLAVAYITQNKLYKNTKLDIVNMPSQKSVPTRTIIDVAPTNSSTASAIEQCIEDTECGLNRKCVEGLCVQNPVATQSILPTATICPSGKELVCADNQCECK